MTYFPCIAFYLVHKKMSIFIIKKCSFREHPTFWVFKGVRLFQGVCLLFSPNFPGGTFIPDGTIIPYFRVMYVHFFSKEYKFLLSKAAKKWFKTKMRTSWNDHFVMIQISLDSFGIFRLTIMQPFYIQYGTCIFEPLVFYEAK